MTPISDPPPARMSGPEYAAYRRRLVAVFAVRVACAGAVIYYWDDLDTVGKVLGIAVAAVVVPNLGSIRRVFVPYERYVREENGKREGRR